MRIKSYFAESVEAAMNQARGELGPDALLMSARRAAGRPGIFEVVFGVAEEKLDASRDAAAAGNSNLGAALPVNQELEQLRRAIEDLRNLVQPDRPATLRVPVEEPDAAALTLELLEEGFHRSLVRDLIHEAQNSSHAQFSQLAGELLPGEARDELRARFRDALARRIRFHSSADPAPPPDARIALVGPSGSGKTTAVIKLAVLEGVLEGRPVHFISVDGDRISAQEPLRSYAALLGAGFNLCASAAGLAEAVENAADGALVLIDTPGFTSLDNAGLEPLAAELRELAGVRTHLVLPACWQVRSMLLAEELFACFQPSRLLFTHLDRTAAGGALCSLAAATGLPLSYFSTGPRIPEDLAPASWERIPGAAVPYFRSTGRAA